MAVFARIDNLVLALCAVLLLSGCQTQPVRPDTTTEASGSGNAFELQQQAYQAYSEGNWAQAEKSYMALTRLVPQEAEPWFRLGNIYAHQNRPQQAVVAYQEALVRKPKYAKAWHNMGIVQLRQASNSFMYLESVTDAGEPLHKRATLLLETMSHLLKSGFTDEETATPTPEPANADSGTQ